jgi:hypothetical protein
MPHLAAESGIYRLQRSGSLVLQSYWLLQSALPACILILVAHSPTWRIWDLANNNMHRPRPRRRHHLLRYSPKDRRRCPCPLPLGDGDACCGGGRKQMHAGKVLNFGIAKISATTEITEFREIFG